MYIYYSNSSYIRIVFATNKKASIRLTLVETREQIKHCPVHLRVLVRVQCTRMQYVRSM